MEAIMKNRLKETLEAGGVAIGAQVRFGSAAIAELFGLAGFDFVVIDSEHAPQHPVGVQAQLQAISGTDATGVVRLGKNDPDLMRVYLDMGAEGIVAPFVNTDHEAKSGADACRYPPRGTRGYGPSRAASFGLNPDYAQQADDEILYIPIIESAEAVEHIEEILAVEGVDTFLVGPVDLSYSLGVPWDFEHQKFLDAIKKVAEAARRAKKPAGLGVYGDLSDPGVFKRHMDNGFRVLLASGDEWMLSAASKKLLEVFNKAKG
jgi:2-keto-3-deoxy-L-rhamnonate aldolase RhmA